MPIYPLSINGKETCEIELDATQPVRLLVTHIIQKQRLPAHDNNNAPYIYNLFAGKKTNWYYLSSELTLTQNRYKDGDILYLQQTPAPWQQPIVVRKPLFQLPRPRKKPATTQPVGTDGSLHNEPEPSPPTTKFGSRKTSPTGAAGASPHNEPESSPPTTKFGSRKTLQHAQHSANKPQGHTSSRSSSSVKSPRSPQMGMGIVFLIVIVGVSMVALYSTSGVGQTNPGEDNYGDIIRTQTPNPRLQATSELLPTPTNPPKPTNTPVPDVVQHIPPKTTVQYPTDTPTHDIDSFEMTDEIGTETPPTIPMPQLVGLLEADAYATVTKLKTIGYELVREGRDCSPYMVVGQEPPAGTHLSPDETVTVYVCPELIVPDVRGQDKDTAYETLANAGFAPTFAQATKNGSEEPDEVWATEPGPGAGAGPGATVTIFFYK